MQPKNPIVRGNAVEVPHSQWLHEEISDVRCSGYVEVPDVHFNFEDKVLLLDSLTIIGSACTLWWLMIPSVQMTVPISLCMLPVCCQSEWGSHDQSVPVPCPNLFPRRIPIDRRLSTNSLPKSEVCLWPLPIPFPPVCIHHEEMPVQTSPDGCRLRPW